MIDRLLAIAAKAAGVFKGCWWMERDDLIQEAIVAMLSAGQKVQLSTVPDAYLWRIAVGAAGTLIRRSSAPVSISWRGKHRLSEFLREDLDDGTPEIAASAEEMLDDARWRALVSARVGELLTEIKEPELATLVLLDEEKPADVAAAKGIEVKVVYNEVAKVRRRIATDARAEALWKQRVA